MSGFLEEDSIYVKSKTVGLSQFLNYNTLELFTTRTIRASNIVDRSSGNRRFAVVCTTT